MASTYSTNLKIELIGVGEQSGAWGTSTNTNLGTAIEQAIVGKGAAVFSTDADLTLSLSNTSAAQVARAFVLNVTGTISATRNLVVPTIEKPYVVMNNTTGGQSIVVKTSAGSGVTVPNGSQVFLYVDGTNVIQMLDAVGDLSYTGTLTGGTGVVNIGSGQLYKDSAGNFGLGVTPSAWTGYKAIDLSASGAVFGDGVVHQWNVGLAQNAYRLTDGTWRYKASGQSSGVFQINGNIHQWYTAPSGTAGNPITFTQAMTLDASGNLLVGTASGSSHAIGKPTSTSAGTTVLLAVQNIGVDNVAVFLDAASIGASSSAGCALRVAVAGTGRSINAAGTVNASGADYAEYECNNGLKITKGSIVGFKADGTLTLTYSDAVRFAVKSTDPSYVGGDVWGSEKQVGKRPEKPTFTAPAYTGPASPGEEPAAPADGADEATIEAYAQAHAVWNEAHAAHEEAMAEHAGAVAAAQAEFEAVEIAAYTAELAAFEARLEAARQLVDRIAYSGKVPCNVTCATPGDYIVATAAADGSITGIPVAEPDFAQYRKAVGRVNRLLPDGRCEVAVIIH